MLIYASIDSSATEEQRDDLELEGDRMKESVSQQRSAWFLSGDYA